MRARLLALAALGALAGSCIVVCGPIEAFLDEAERQGAIDAERWLEDVRVLSSDEFEGRAPGTPGEERTIEYLVRQLSAAGLEPGAAGGSWTQDVPLVGITSKVEARLTVAGQSVPLEMPGEAVMQTRRLSELARVEEAQLVFAGYGVVAPEYGWDDYKGLDVRGKVLLVLVGDPPVPDAQDPTRLDEQVFGGRAMTYYGRWTYKYEIAAQRGAAGVLVVHQTAPAGYPWGVPSQGFGGEEFELESADRNQGRAAAEGWITHGKTSELLGLLGHDFRALEAAAARRDFAPVELDARLSATITSRLRRVASRNVVAKLTGADPARRGEALVYMAHWDHLGRDESIEGDGIYNGAVDNASGVAGVLEIARALVARRCVVPRSVLFLLVTAEEQGLLGSRHFAAYPTHPLERLLAAINIDAMSVHGPTADVVCIGWGQSSLDETLLAAAAAQGRIVRPDPRPERGGYYRSDHFELAQVGVPSLYADGGLEVIGQPPGWGLARHEEYVARDYHQPSDELRADWDAAGVARDLELLVLVGIAVANAAEWPSWKASSEFRARRERQLAAAGR